ncbi:MULTISPECIES: lanthionine synthetase LanC family protein [unclassified Pedobacter]|uniref:lanthionine synthetase LanC family protein n=1 Tax=unclassified Pedobacter TaxID=2628915 RepID=UPI00141E25F8|nr:MULTISPECIES: lanthionine synthetase LanC family protein [unclassified Pedobacter]NII82854.1 lantibiotic modifying enzyme [Pedobacter sp. SG908]NMN36872.1 lantibiotic modifying enzyme [Pedobacter sp. SG918]
MFTVEEIKRLKDQLYEIYGELISSFKENEQEIWWQTPFYINPDEYELRESYDLFNGNCGIILFFLELYQFDGNSDHLRIVDKGMHRILNANAVQHPKFFALYTGLGGVIYTCLKVFEVAGNTFYKEKALELTLAHKQELTAGLSKADLLSGYSGNLLMLTLLYHHTGDNEVLNMVSLLIERLITEARISEQGLKWDYSSSKKAYDSMTGFSHGAAGIALVLMQVGQYFKANGLIYLAEEALKYEMQYYYSPSKNWLDLRLGPHRLNKADVHEWKLQTFLAEMTDVNAWAHGAAGVGITRQMALQLTKQKQYRLSCSNALQRCLDDLEKLDRTDFTLVSGYCGMIPLLLNHKKKAQIVLILDKAKMLYQKTNSYNAYVSCGCDDYGLLSGKSGIGYIILNVLNNKTTNSILTPELPKNYGKSIFEDNYTEKQVKKSVFSKYYTRTLEELKAVDSTIFDVKDIDEFKMRLELLVLASSNTRIQKIFDLEGKLVNLWKQHKGYFSFEQKYRYLYKMANESLSITDQALMAKSFGLSAHIELYHHHDDLNDPNILLLISEGSGIKELSVGVFAAVILNTISKKKLTGVELVKSIQALLFEENPTKKSLTELENKVVKQIRLLIKAGFVMVH